MDQHSFDSLVDLIYDTPVDPSGWPRLMERIADAVGGTGAWLSQLNLIDNDGGGVLSRIDPAMTPIYRAHFAQRNPLSNVDNPDAYVRGWTPKILTDEDWMPKADLVASEYYNDFLHPQNVHSTVMIRLAMNGYDLAVLNINRPRGREQFGPAELELLRALHPHLIRAFRLSERFLGLTDLNESMAEVLDHTPHALFVLDDDGRIRHANRNAQVLMAADAGLAVRHGRLTARSPNDARRLAAMIAIAALPVGAVADTMVMCTPSRRLPLSISVSPGRAEQYSLFHRGRRVVVCITDPEAKVAVSQRKLRDLFALTTAESRVAVALFEGMSPTEAAEEFGVSLNTVRAQMGSIFQKTDTRRQSELVALMTRTVAAELG